MKKMIFLEGLPGVGKSTIVRNIEKRQINNIYTVAEIVEESIFDNINSTNQNIYIQNDILKINKYQDGTIIIDRGPISTLAYNLVKAKINAEFSSKEVEEWFDCIKSIYRDDTQVYFLKGSKDYFIPYEDDLDPYGSVENQKLLEKVTIDIIKRYVKNYKIVEYKKEKMEDLIDEIIN